jgi:hypothetical protein
LTGVFETVKSENLGVESHFRKKISRMAIAYVASKKHRYQGAIARKNSTGSLQTSLLEMICFARKIVFKAI